MGRFNTAAVIETPPHTPFAALAHRAISDKSDQRGADAEARFGQPHARLFPYVGKVVQTPFGRGKLLQVFADRTTVDLGRQLVVGGVIKPVVDFFRPDEIEPLP